MIEVIFRKREYLKMEKKNKTKNQKISFSTSNLGRCPARINLP